MPAPMRARRPYARRMAGNDAEIAWFLDLLAPAGRMTARRMFGGAGLYADGVMIALEANGTLYLKVDDASRARFDAAGGVAFAFEMKTRGTVTMHYMTPPDEALDSPAPMRPWALLALEAARRAAAKKVPRRRRR